MAKRGRPVTYRVVDGVIYKVCARCKVEKPETEYAKFSPEAYERYRMVVSSKCNSCCLIVQKDIIARRKDRLAAGACIIPIEKKCSECGISKPIDEFGTNRSLPDAHSIYCKTCSSKLRKERWNQCTDNTRRSALKRLSIAGSHSTKDWRIMCGMFDNKCPACGTADKLTRDHVFPVTRHGTDNISNIQPLCLSCNASKGNRELIDYRWKIYHKLKDVFDMSLPQLDCELPNLI